jgi:hypothetical protein
VFLVIHILLLPLPCLQTYLYLHAAQAHEFSTLNDPLKLREWRAFGFRLFFVEVALTFAPLGPLVPLALRSPKPYSCFRKVARSARLFSSPYSKHSGTQQE